MKSQEQLRKEWHEFFVAHKDRFTDDRYDAVANKKIYVGREVNWRINPTLRNTLEIQYQGRQKFVPINWKRKRRAVDP